ncbi:MAG: phage tail tape measure protein [Bacteroidales bacterium]|nr:phage tail tape measure protein [Bacteroidales bacterium]
MANETATARVELDGQQADNQLKELTARAREMKKELKELRLAKDPGYEAKKREFDALDKKIKDTRKSTFDLNAVMKDLSGASLKELTRAQRTLNSELRTMNRNTAEGKKVFADKTAQLQRVQTEIQKTTAQMRGFNQQQTLMQRIAGGFNRYFGMIAAFSASILGSVMGFKKLVEEFNEYQAAVSNLSALTGLAGEQLDWLSERAKAASTGATEDGVRFTNAAIDIVNAYTLIGSKRPELLANREALAAVTEEAMILSKAANITLVPAATALTTTMNQFNVSASEARRIINTLGAGSKVGAGDIPYLNAVIEKSGTSAYNAKIEIEELVGVIEGIAPKFSQPEIAGTQLRTMFIRLQSGADDVNPAIVGMEQALDNLAAKQYSVADLTKLFGLESINMALALIDSREEIKRYTAAVSDTNIAVEQAIINSDNNKTRLEQARNRAALLRMELGEKLAPALTFSTNAFSYLIKAIMGGIKFWEENRSLIIATLSAIIAYTIATNGAIIAKKTFTAVLWLGTKAMQAFNLVVKVNPWALAASAIIGLLVYIRQLGRETESLTIKQKAYNEIRQQATEGAAEEVAQLDKLFTVLKNTNITAETRNRLIKQINDQYKDYLPSLLSEKSTLQEIETAYNNVATALRNKIEMEVQQEKAKKLFAEADIKKDELKAIEGMTAAEYNKQNNIVEGVRGAARERAINGLKKEINEILEVYNELMNQVAKTPGAFPPPAGGGEDDTPDPDPNGDVSTAYENITKAINDARKAQAAFVAEGNYAAARQADVVIKTLEAQKLVIDGIIANGGDVIGFLDNLTDSEESLLQESDAFNKKFLEDWKGTFDEIKSRKEQDHQEDLDRTSNRIQFELDEEAKKNAKKEKLEKDWESARKQIVDDSLNAGFQMFTNYINSQYDRQMYALNQRRDAELNNENLTAEQREKIQERYRVQEAKIKEQAWKRQHRADIIQSIINTALAVSRAWSAAPGGWANLPMVVAAGISGALQTAVIASQKMPQFVKGRYNVIGKDDNKLYKDVPFMGPAKTGIYRNALVGEKGDELIIDNPTLRNIRVNFPEVMQAIHAARVPQYSQGRLSDPPAATTNQQPATNNPQPATDPALLAALNRLNDKLDQGIESYLVYQKFRKFEDKVSQTENDNAL